MTIEAFWKVEYFFDGNRAPSIGAGVVIFESGHIYGGDTSFYFKGEYSIDRKLLKANVRVRRHSLGLPSLIGVDDYSLIVDGELIRGDYNGDLFVVEGYPDVMPAQKIQIGFARIENLK